MQYIIISSNKLGGLENKINAWAKQGWIMQGGPFKVANGKYGACMGRSDKTITIRTTNERKTCPQ